jgi:endonuclease/exonuclease/phosphatase family metal-dependent hydrolase
MVMRINKIIFLSVAFLALASSCVKEEVQEDTTQTQSPEKAILKSLLAARDTKWTAEDLDIPTLNGEWYEITTANELAYLLEFGSTKGEKYRLMANIDVSVSSIADMFPGEIGAESFENFEFDGNEKIISGLDLPLAAGLFSRVKHSKIYDFTLASTTVGSKDNVSNLLGTGAVIGSASGEIVVSNVTVSGCNVYAPYTLGGFVGAVMDGSATFTSCKVADTNVNGIFLKGISGWCGGFVGFVGRTREDDTASMVNVTFDNCDVNEGAVKPYMESDLRTCGQFLGMLIGFDSNETVTMSGCDVQTTYEVQTNEGQDAKSQVNPIIGGHKYENGIILVDGRDYNELSVISFNIKVKGGFSELINPNSWSRRKSATPAMIKDQCPDIFGVQEALSDQLTYVGGELPNYSYVGVGREDGKKISEITDSEASGEIMAIFYNKSEIDLLDWGTYWLSETPGEPSISWEADFKRTMTWAKMQMKYSGKKFFYVNTHLDNHSGTAREEGLKLIVKKIAEMNIDNLPVVLTGDFNVTPGDSVLKVLDNAEMLDARTTATKTDDLPTFNGLGDENENPRVIDYIYYRGFSSCPEYETIVKQYANVQYISDHYPIVARLMF